MKISFYIFTVSLLALNSIFSLPILRPNSGPTNYILQLSSDIEVFRYSFGDLDGDGNLDPVVKAVYLVGAVYKVEGYRHDGTRLWSQDTYWPNRQGTGDYIHEINLIWDLDATGGQIQAGDGKWEVVYNYKRNDGSNGIRIVNGDGTTRKDIAWPGPSNGNKGQHRGCIAYLDGQNPSIIINDGGEYSAGTLYAFDKDLNVRWTYSGNNYAGHMIIPFDLDGNGTDEVIAGGVVLNGDGSKRIDMPSRGYGYMDMVQPGDLITGNGKNEIYYLATSSPLGQSHPLVVDQNGTIIWTNTDVFFCDHNARGWAADVFPSLFGNEFYAEDHTYELCGDGKIPKGIYNEAGELIDQGTDNGRVYNRDGNEYYDFGRADAAADLNRDGGEENWRWDNTQGQIAVEFGTAGDTPHRWGNRSYMVQVTCFASGYGPYMYTPRTSVISGTDVIPPRITSIKVIDANTIELQFNGALEQSSTENVNNYSIDKGIGTPLQALLMNGDKVTLTLNSLSSWKTYTLTVNNVRDPSGNIIPENSLTTFGTAAVGIQSIISLAGPIPLLGYPNPFRSAVQISLAMDEGVPVNLDIIDLQGRVIRNLIKNESAAGQMIRSWDGRNDQGRLMPAGIYQVRLQKQNQIIIKNLVLIK